MDPERRFGDRGAHGAADARVLGAPRREAPGPCPRSARAGSRPAPGPPLRLPSVDVCVPGVGRKDAEAQAGECGAPPRSGSRPGAGPASLPARPVPAAALQSDGSVPGFRPCPRLRGPKAEASPRTPPTADRAGRPAPREGPGVLTRDRARAVLGLAEPALCLCLRCRLPPLESAGKRRGF